MKLSIFVAATLCLSTQAAMASDYYAVLEDNVMVLKPLEVIYSGDNIFVISEGKEDSSEVIIGHRASDTLRLFSSDKGKTNTLVRVSK